MSGDKKTYKWIAVLKRDGVGTLPRIVRFRSSNSYAEVRIKLEEAGFIILRHEREAEIEEIQLDAVAREGRERALAETPDWQGLLWPYGGNVLENWIAYYSNPSNEKVTDWDAQVAVYYKAQETAHIALRGVRLDWQNRQGVIR